MKQTSDSPLALLRDVSRSFYLTLRVLPRAIRPQIGFAYLLARTSDTIADTELVPVATRLSALARFRDNVLGESDRPIDLPELTSAQSSRAERMLLERINGLRTALMRFERADQERIRQVFSTIVSGQELDLRRFATASGDRIVALATVGELDDYIYRVAGCVGEFWTHMCRAHLFPLAILDESELLENAVRFGKGLQLVNILRDLPADLRMGRCYLPSDQLCEVQLSPRDLLDPSHEDTLRPIYNQYLEQAEAHLVAGWRYTETLPYRHWRVRLACAWPILIGIRTLRELRRANVLDAAHRVKLSRKEVRRLLLQSSVRVPFPIWFRHLVRDLGSGDQ